MENWKSKLAEIKGEYPKHKEKEMAIKKIKGPTFTFKSVKVEKKRTVDMSHIKEVDLGAKTVVSEEEIKEACGMICPGGWK